MQRRRNETDPRRSGEVQRAPDSVAKRQRLLHNLSGGPQRYPGCSDAVPDVIAEKSRSIFYI